MKAGKPARCALGRGAGVSACLPVLALAALSPAAATSARNRVFILPCSFANTAGAFLPHRLYRATQTLGKRGAQLILLLVALGAAGCGGGSSSGGTTTPPPSNPVPSISSISPASATAGGSAFTLTVYGSNFISSSVIQWNGASQTTSYVSATQLSTMISAADIATGQNASVTVMNPAPGGGTSSAIALAVTAPVPALNSLSPSSAVAGSPAITLTVNGSGFLASSVIEWNGNSRTTSYVSATQLTTAISAADIAAGQNAAVSVINPAPGGGTSAEISFAVDTPSPSVASISPSSAEAGGAAFTLTVNGTNFLPGSTVQWNGAYGQPPLSTTYVNSTELTVAIPANDIAFAGDANVTVLNLAPGGGVSPAAVFTITGTIPSNVSFVAPNGNDANPGTIAQPYLTIQMCATTASSGDICAVRAGTYRETVTPNSGMTITSYDGEPVTVDGSNPVTGWSLYQGSIYKASVTLASDDSNQIFAGGQMMTEARWPNGNDLFHVSWATLGTGTTTTQVVDPSLPNINWTGAKIHLWSGSDPWEPQTGTITASSQGQLTFTLDGTAIPPYIEPTAGGYYYLYRLLGALDAQDEWFYDSSAGILYFWAPGGVNPGTLNVTAKQRQYGFDLSGRSNVTIESINLFATTINMDSSSANNTLDGINAQYLSQFTDLPDAPGNPGSAGYDYVPDSGIIINGAGNVLENSAIAYSAGNGVALTGSSNTITNNLIKYINYVADACSGISLTFGAGNANEIDYNTIYATGRDAIEYNAGLNEDISYNNFFGAMMLSRDGGEIYASLPSSQGGAATGTDIHDNWFHDTSLSQNAAGYAPTAGVYLDEDTNGVEVDQNVFWNNQYFSVLLNYSNDGITAPNNNYVRNSTIPDVNSNSYIYTDLNTPCGTTQIANNLVLVPITQTGTVCTAINNSSSAPGATDMTSSVQVGCNFIGCSSEGPPEISGTSVAASIAVQPYNMTVPSGQPVTFAVTGAGSPTLTYQWQRNGAAITGATSASYTISATSAADNGAVFTVAVGNSLGSVTSNPAMLTVQ